MNLRHVAKMAAAIVIPGGLAMAAITGGAYALLLSWAKTGNADLDRLRGKVCAEAFKVFGLKALAGPALVRALMAVLHNENDPRTRIDLGDRDAKGGPSIGPMQVYRATAKDLGLWSPPPGASDTEERAAYAALASDEGLGIAWGVRVFKNKLELAGGDLAQAIRRYNGSGPKAEAYRDRALAFAQTTWTSNA